MSKEDWQKLRTDLYAILPIKTIMTGFALAVIVGLWNYGKPWLQQELVGEFTNRLVAIEMEMTTISESLTLQDDLEATRSEILGEVDQRFASVSDTIAAGFEEQRALLNEVKTSVRVLSQPRVIFELLPGSQFPEPCIRGETCVVSIIVERKIEALACTLVSTQTVHEVTSNIDNRRRTISVASGSPPPINVQDEATQFEIPLTIPRFMPIGPATYNITTSYSNCPSQLESDELITQRSRSIPLQVVE